ncbi:ADP-ribosylglycohydrolase family protein [Catenuloplanes indicus]|uniref:ADP-ribosylglycohydrolase n=1 Tax=Catenuloplanes indicus TaxID=137267 RepID=A0AAE3VV30_9ACTN|nr:ADP-ribosylglycohydrolase family protein [Catenuloplanes indicus]MDQ0364239.1 ADP-ribosylglycohydrolase [Catenuloplanes indicus]
MSGSRQAGAVVGSAVGDALGAPFEFGPAGAFAARFPVLGGGPNEMCGGGGWEPGEATDDTQMAVLVADSLLERGRLDPADVFARFRRWAAAEPKDIGLQTEIVLTGGLPWDRAAADHAARHRRAAGNGSLMRATTAAVHFAARGRAATMAAGRTLSALTHGDPAAGEGCAAYHELIRIAVAGGDVPAAVPATVAALHPGERDRWATVLDPSWEPGDATESNGAVWPTLGCALWALRTTGTFPDAVRAAIDLGGDTDTIAAVTGGLAGAVYGLDAIPRRWRDRLFVPMPGAAPLDEAALIRLAGALGA